MKKIPGMHADLNASKSCRIAEVDRGCQKSGKSLTHHVTRPES